MEPAIRLTWKVSDAASYFTAARALMLGGPPVDAGLASSLEKPLDQLRSALNEAHVACEAFWSHVIPLSAAASGFREMAEVALIKTIGRGEMACHLTPIQGALFDLNKAVREALPDVKTIAAEGEQALKAAWSYQGEGLVRAILTVTEPDLLVGDATVVIVHPVQGGGGVAYLPYNLVHIEALPKDPNASLPEIVRLAWLLSMLNLDVPEYSEQVTPRRLPLVAALAMIPATLSAGASISLTQFDEATIGEAARAWLPPAETVPARSSLLFQWWETYRTARPRFGTALGALEKLLADDTVLDT